MQVAIGTTENWITVKTTVIPRNTSFMMKINILDKTLTQSYLILQEENMPPACFIPITDTINVNLINDTMILTFTDFNAAQVQFSFTNSTDLEMVTAHFSRASFLYNTKEDQFINENMNFISLIASPTKIIIPQGQTASKITSVLTPIPTTATAKDIWQENSMKINQQFYLKPTEIRFSFLTWNVAGKRPQEDVLSDIVRCFRVPFAPSDIIVIAFQEIDMSVKSVVTGSSNRSDKWTDIVHIAQTLFGTGKLELVASESLGSVYCAALVRSDVVPKPVIGEIQTIKLGVGGLFANKAALLIPITIGESKSMAVACHLAPHEPNLEERNEQWRLIAKSVGDGVDFFSMMGDLNYRVVLPYEQAVQKANNDQLLELLESDQLTQMKRKDKVIGSFKEAEIQFRPTYKFDKNCDVYDTSAKKRVPSWTDRILLRTGKQRLRMGCEDKLYFETDATAQLLGGSDLLQLDTFDITPPQPNFPSPPKCICYRSLRCSFSDHRPVHAAYKYTVPVADESRRSLLSSIVEEKYQELRRLSVPRLLVEPADLEYAGQTEAEVVLRNGSLVWVEWAAKKVPRGCLVEPAAGRLLINESVTVRVRFAEGFIPGSIAFDVTGTRAAFFKIHSDAGELNAIKSGL